MQYVLWPITATIRFFVGNLLFLAMHRFKQVTASEIQSVIRVCTIWIVVVFVLGGALSIAHAETNYVYGTYKRLSKDISTSLSVEYRKNLYQIRLNPPDYSNTDSVKQHLAYSRIWGILLHNELASVSNGACVAIILPTIFPNLLATFLDSSQAADHCLDKLTELLSGEIPSTEAIVSAVRAITAENRAIRSLTVGFQANDIFLRALREIYVSGSTMSALLSVDDGFYQTIEESAFQKWLGKQKTLSNLTVTKLPAQTVHDASHSGIGIDFNLPFSPRTKPTSVNIHLSRAELQESNGHIDGMLLLPIVSSGSKAGAPTLGLDQFVVQKYCDNQQRFPADGIPGGDAYLHIRCLYQAPFGASWIVLYCDPTDCTNPNRSLVALTAIQSDLEERERLATSNETSGITTEQEISGAYLVVISRQER